MVIPCANRQESLYISCALLLQPRSTAACIDAHLRTAFRARRCRLTTQFESQTSFTLPLVLHQPYPRFGDDQRARNDNWQRLCPPKLVDPRTTLCRSARTIAVYIHSLPNRNTAVRTTRAYRRTTLCNSRAHIFVQLPQHRTGTRSSTGTRTASPWLHKTQRNKSHECHSCSVVLSGKLGWTRSSQAVSC